MEWYVHTSLNRGKKKERQREGEIHEREAHYTYITPSPQYGTAHKKSTKFTGNSVADSTVNSAWRLSPTSIPLSTL
jgi:hypothetical protein